MSAQSPENDAPATCPRCGCLPILASGEHRCPADHARCLRCGTVVHLLLTAHHDAECPRVIPPAVTDGGAS